MNKRIADEAELPTRIKPRQVADWLLEHEISSVTIDEMAVILGIPRNQVSSRMVTLRNRLQFVALTLGLWMPVAPEHRYCGAPPAIEIIDVLMNHFNIDYYIGWLWAAQLHGVAHIAIGGNTGDFTQPYQVATSRMVKDREIGIWQFQFFMRKRIGSVGLVHLPVKDSEVPVSSVETTLLDLANDIDIVGGIDSAAGIIIQLCRVCEPNIGVLTALSDVYPITAVRRLGYILERFLNMKGLGKLKKASDERNTTTTLLDPSIAKAGRLNTRWNLRVNKKLSPDI